MWTQLTNQRCVCAHSHIHIRIHSKVTEVRGNFVEDECYQMATEFQETSLRPDISVLRAHDM